MSEKPQLFDLPCPICGKTTFTLPFIPKITHRVICPRCQTPSILHITSSLGIRIYRQDEYEKARCKNCNGTGKCSTCKGTGKIKCPKCKGYGFYEDEDAYTYGCEVCGGSGYSEYSMHLALKQGGIEKGSGKVECEACGGTGVCSACGGEGVLL